MVSELDHLNQMKLASKSMAQLATPPLIRFGWLTLIVVKHRVKSSIHFMWKLWWGLHDLTNCWFLTLASAQTSWFEQLRVKLESCTKVENSQTKELDRPRRVIWTESPYLERHVIWIDLHHWIWRNLWFHEPFDHWQGQDQQPHPRSKGQSQCQVWHHLASRSRKAMVKRGRNPS